MYSEVKVGSITCNGTYDCTHIGNLIAHKITNKIEHKIVDVITYRFLLGLLCQVSSSTVVKWHTCHVKSPLALLQFNSDADEVGRRLVV